MFFIPASIMFSWPLPNFVNPVTRGQSTLIVSALTLSITTLFVAVRLYQRIFVRKWFGPDDLFIIIGYIFSIAVTIITGLGDNYGWNKHLWDLRVTDYQPSMELLYFARIFWGQSTSFVRLSVLCLYYRLLRASNAPTRYYHILYVTIAMAVTLQTYYFLSGVFPCTPIKAYWIFPILEGSHCFNDGASFQAAAVVNTVLEFWIATLPLLGTFYLKVSPSKAWSVLFVLCGGYLVCLAGTIRTYYIWKTVSSYDFTWWSGPQWMASEVEIGVALICACAAPIRPLAGRIARRLNRRRQDQVMSSDHSRSRRESKSTIPTKITDAKISQDLEAVQEWTEAMRTIDLEGIRNDGFGYTVTISGPTGNNRKPLLGGLRLPWPRNSNPRSIHGKSKQTIMTQQTVVTVEKAWPSNRESSQSKQLDLKTDRVSPESLDEMTFESMGLQINGLLDDDARGERQPPMSPTMRFQQTFRSNNLSPRFSYYSELDDDDESSDSGIQALPIMPTPTSSNKPAHIGEVSWFGEPPRR